MSYASPAAYRGHSHAVQSHESVGEFASRCYFFLFLALFGMSVTALVSAFFVPETWLTGIIIADAVLWIACGWLGLRQPLALIFPVFCIVSGLLLGKLASMFPQVFLLSASITIVAFGGLSLFTIISGINFSFLKGFLFMAFFVLVIGGLVSYFLQIETMTIAYCGFGVFTFSCWILYDTSRIFNDTERPHSAGEAAFELFLDMLGLFYYVFRIALALMSEA